MVESTTKNTTLLSTIIKTITETLQNKTVEDIKEQLVAQTLNIGNNKNTTKLGPMKPSIFSKKYNSRCLIEFLGPNTKMKDEVIDIIYNNNPNSIVVTEEYLLKRIIKDFVDKGLFLDEINYVLDELFNKLENAQLLIIKDVGKSYIYRKESFGIIFLLLHKRYFNNKPTIITTTLIKDNIPDYFRQSYNDFIIEGLETYYFNNVLFTHKENCIYKEVN